MTSYQYQCGRASFSNNNVEYLFVGHQNSISNTTEADFKSEHKQVGVFSNLLIFVTTNSLNNSATITLRKSESDVNGTLSVTSSTTGIFEDTTNTDTVVSGDEFTIGVDGTVASSGSIEGQMTITFSPTSEQNFIVRIMQLLNVVGLRRGHIFSTWASSATQVEFKVKHPITLDKLWVNVVANAQDATTDYYTVIDDVQGNLLVSVATVTTGQFEDLSNSDDIALDQEIRFDIDAMGTGSIDSSVAMDMVSSGYTITSAKIGSTISSGQVKYTNIITSTIKIDEGETQQVFKPATFDKMETKVLTNSADYIITLTFRIDGVNGNQVNSVGAGLTGYFADTTNSDTIRDSQKKITVQLTAGTGTGTVNFSIISGRMTNKQFGRPDADQSIGSWEDEVGGTTNIYQSIDEVIPDDTDFIISEVEPSTSVYVAKINSIVDPQTGEDHVVRYRYKKDVASVTIDIIVRLKQGATTIASETKSNISTTITEGTLLLTPTEANNITDYTDLRIEITADVP